MSIFGSIMSKIFSSAETAVGIGRNNTASSSTPASLPDPAAAPQSASTAGASASAPSDSSGTKSQAQVPVDVEAVLSQMASQKGGGGNYQTSIVDLLKLLDLDSSLNARKELGQELNVHVGPDGSAEENIALHKAVMRKLAENGGKVPDSMKG